VSIYCPSCGKPNTDQAEKCASCGADLGKAKPAGAKKFKGTMMMGATGPKPPTPGSPVPGPGGGAGSPGAPSPGPASPAQGPPAPAATGTPAGAPDAGSEAEAPKKNLAFQATMLGGAGPVPPAGPGAPAPGGQPRIPGPPPPAAGPPGSTPPPEAGAVTPAPASPGGGFGAPPETAAEGPAPGAAGGFGAGAGGAPGVGAADAPQPGWGAQAGAEAPAAPGGGWGGVPAATPGAGTGGLGANKKLIIGVAAGCLGLMLLVCIAGVALMIFQVGEYKSQSEEAASSFAAEASRVSLGFTLSGIQMGCQGGGPQGVASFFHPGAFSQLGDQVCNIDARAIDVFSDSDQSTAQVLSQSAMADRASSLGLDPDTCFLYEADGARIVGCALEDGFKVVHMENLGSL
jgi:hypothetical protein